LRICHDLRTPLRSLHTHTELLLKDLGGEPITNLEERLGFIVDGARRIDLLIEGLVGYSLALQTNAESFQTVQMETMLRTALTKLDRELSANDAEVSYDKLPAVRGDPDRLIRLFESLIRNALHHRGPAAPRIHVTAKEHAEEWLFAFRDNGPGVEEQYVETIFKPFERLGTKRHRGPGLGLAICRAIVERHGGRIWAESKPGTGAAFFFTLPRTAD
jgi:signal transduction histidine kinase